MVAQEESSGHKRLLFRRMPWLVRGCFEMQICFGGTKMIPLPVTTIFVGDVPFLYTWYSR